MSLRFTNLDRISIRAMKPGEKVTEHGVTVARLKNGDARYSVNVMVDGQRIHRVIGLESDGVTRTQCEDFIEARRTEAREGRLSLPQGRKTHLTFSQSADDFITRLEETGGKNIKAKKRQFRMYLKPFFKSQRLNAISTFTVDRYKKRRLDAGANPGTVNRELATLSHLFTMALKWKWVKERPCYFELLKESKGRIIALSDEEADSLLTAAVADEDPDCWLFVLFGLNTAMRHTEILCTRYDQVDFDKLRLYVPDAKAGQREQPITPELASTLKNELSMRDDQEGWIFPSPRPGASSTGHRERMGKPFRRAVIAAELDPATITPHVMRHTAITNLVKAGVDLPTIQKISGHKTLAMVLRYTHVHGTHIDEAIKSIGRSVPEHPENKHKKKAPKLRTI
jgi:integrase